MIIHLLIAFWKLTLAVVDFYGFALANSFEPGHILNQGQDLF